MREHKARVFDGYGLSITWYEYVRLAICARGRALRDIGREKMGAHRMDEDGGIANTKARRRVFDTDRQPDGRRRCIWNFRGRSANQGVLPRISEHAGSGYLNCYSRVYPIRRRILVDPVDIP